MQGLGYAFNLNPTKQILWMRINCLGLNKLRALTKGRGDKTIFWLIESTFPYTQLDGH